MIGKKVTIQVFVLSILHLDRLQGEAVRFNTTIVKVCLPPFAVLLCEDSEIFTTGFFSSPINFLTSLTKANVKFEDDENF